MAIIAAAFGIWAVVGDASLELQVAVGLFAIGGGFLIGNGGYGLWLKLRWGRRFRLVPQADEEQLRRPYVKGLAFRITDLCRDTNVISDKVFEECDVAGPAILLPVGEADVFAHCSFNTGIKSEPDVQPDAYLWEIPNDQGAAVGVVAIRNCVFRRCRFLNVGLAGKQNVIQSMRGAIETMKPPAV